MDEETLEELKDELKKTGAKTAHVRLAVPAAPPSLRSCRTCFDVRLLTARVMCDCR